MYLNDRVVTEEDYVNGEDEVIVVLAVEERHEPLLLAKSGDFVSYVWIATVDGQYAREMISSAKRS